MLLSNALFEQIASTLNAPAAAPEASPAPRSEGQRRREPRVGVRAEVTVIPLTDAVAAAPFTVPVRDVSPGGIGFFHGSRIGLDELFVVMLPHGGESLAVLCQVVHYQPLAEKVFAVGARFVRVLRDGAGATDDPAPAATSRAA